MDGSSQMLSGLHKICGFLLQSAGFCHVWLFRPLATLPSNLFFVCPVFSALLHFSLPTIHPRYPVLLLFSVPNTCLNSANQCSLCLSDPRPKQQNNIGMPLPMLKRIAKMKRKLSIDKKLWEIIINGQWFNNSCTVRPKFQAWYLWFCSL